LNASFIPDGQFMLNGPNDKADTARLPVRGDLAHIGLAGRWFVPHYAVPQPRKVAAGGAVLRAAMQDDAVQVTELEAGSVFEVLDIQGAWAWGGCGPEGPAGYVPLDRLEGAEA